ncbi:MAG TPA: farnesyl diphosphate synthase [Planktothrix sp.]|jgi:geranylgeranyl diphosphate synthase type II
MTSLAPEFDFKSYTDQRRMLVEQRLQEYLSDSDPKVIWDSMRYSILSGGKRLRALLCLAGAEAVRDGADALDLALPCACAIEMIHAMSLIHDDLPCMDNDDFRRGKPTNHKVFGEAMALLAGDALLMHAIDILIDKTPGQVDRKVLLHVTRQLARATGAVGMVGGQVEDMLFTGSRPDNGVEASSTISDVVPDAKIIESIHRRKTGALIRFSIWSGAKLCGGLEPQLKGLDRLGEIVGLAFQITDDLLDVTGDIKTLGKTPGKDEAAQKATWVRVFGVDGARQKLEQLEIEGEELITSLSIEKGSMPALSSLLKYAIHRVN